MSPPETTAAFAKARELATSIEDPVERFSAYYGLWVGPFIRGDLAQMREVAEAFMRDAERSPALPEVGIAHRLLGTTCWYAGDYAAAQVQLEQALARYDHARDLHLSSSFAYDQGCQSDPLPQLPLKWMMVREWCSSGAPMGKSTVQRVGANAFRCSSIASA